MTSERKYKYTVKKFAKMLTVHPDKRVTFQDEVDLRDFIGNNVGDLSPPPEYASLTNLVAAVLSGDWMRRAERVNYWPNLVEYGELLAIGLDGDDNSPSAKIVGVGGRFILGVQFELNPEQVAAWLAATGFPQMSRAKEAPDESVGG